MDELLSRAGSQAVSFAIKSSVSLASTYAIKQFTKFLTNVPQKDANRLEKLRRQLETRIDIINNAIGLIKLCVVRGNTNLGSTLSLILDLKDELNGFNIEMDQLALDSAGVNFIGLKENGGKKSAVALMEARMNELIHRIELVIPLINLSMTTSGVSSSMKLPNNVSPSLLLQASNMVIKSNENAAATQYEHDIQVGPLFEVTSFNVFDKSSKIIWKEHITRCDLRIVRYAAHNKDNIDYNYYIELRENFNDGRYHDLKEDQPKKSRYQIHQIVRLFFTVSGKLLNLEERDSPVLVLKLDKNLKRDGNSSSTEDIEWIAFGEYEEVVDDSESEAGEEEAEEEQKKRVLRKLTKERMRMKVATKKKFTIVPKRTNRTES
ncbi:Yrb30p Ecym_6117 [Eremothecium cymbalariae DBVPG|uniref:Ran-specific GTPase-activating protein 30 n=1 Tax=Eremothecium cymbalariae (strain CBS 270.75 / DBVPG 7215 / KCTC 17166 / NRRL Y-17582) TaxID=931890 RepID=G8JV31_ERECY|nr:hypothetical protein Ecym_6117 [Eremothecium cymbalariae DBVPG\